MWLTLKLWKKGLILVGVPLVFELLFVIFLVVLLNRAEKTFQQQEHIKVVVSQANWVTKSLTEGTILLWRYSTSRTSAADQSLNKVVIEVGRQFDKLKDLTRNDHESQPAMKRLGANLDHVRIMFAAGREASEFGDDIRSEDRRYLLQMDAQAAYARYLDSAEVFVSEQKQAMRKSPGARAQSVNLVRYFVIAGLCLNLFVAIGLALYFNRGTTSRLSRLVANARCLARGQPLSPTLSGEDEIARLDLVFHDMARKLTEAARKERAALHYARDVICSFDDNGRFTAVGASSARDWGYNPEELTGMQYLQLVAPDHVEHTKTAVDDIRSKGLADSFENSIMRKDGSIIHALWSARWSESEKSFFCVAHDISERKQLEELKQRFLSMVSHDLRAPLTSVLGFIALTAKGAYGELSAKGLERLSMAQRSIRRLLNLINDLLDVERMEAGKFQLKLERIPLASILEDSAESVHSFAEKHGIRVELPATNQEINADGQRLVQVLVNLLSNAIKFSPKGASVSVEIESLDHWFELKVIDRGRGIPKEFKDLVFERFRQVEAADASQKGGTGLGLPICKAIIEAHGGVIGVESVPGQGATFWFRLPVTPDTIVT